MENVRRRHSAAARFLCATATGANAVSTMQAASGFTAFGIYTGYPVPAAFATTGAMAGIGLSLDG